MRLLFTRKGSNYFVYSVRHGYEVVPAEALCGHCGGAYAHAGGLHGAAFFSGDAVFVQRYGAAVQRLLNHLSGYGGMGAGEVQKEHVVIRAAGHNLVTHARKLRRHSAAVFHHAAYVCTEFRRKRLLRRHGLCRYGVHMRAARHAREQRAVHLPGVFLFAEYQCGAYTAQRFMRGGGNNIGMTKGRRMLLRRHKAGYVRNVRHEQRAVFMRYARKAFKIDNSAVCRRAGYYQLGPRLFCHVLHAAHVYIAPAVKAVMLYVIKPASHAYGQAVAYMPAHLQIKAKYRVPGPQQRRVGRHVRVGTAERLHVDVIIRRKHLLPLLPAVFFQLIHNLAAAVIAPARISFGIFIGKAASGGLQHIFGHKVFRCYKLYRAVLPVLLPLYKLKYLVHYISPALKLLFRIGSGVGYESPEQRGEVRRAAVVIFAAEALGVELGAEYGQGFVLECLNYALYRVRGRPQAGGKLLYSLMMGAVGFELLAEKLMQYAARLGIDIVANVLIAMHIAALLHKILIERAAEGHVEHLHAAANAHYGLFARHKFAYKGKLELAARRVCLYGVVKHLFAVKAGFNVPAAREQKRVAKLAQLFRPVLRPNHRHAARAVYRVAIGHGHLYLARGFGEHGVIGAAGNAHYGL